MVGARSFHTSLIVAALFWNKAGADRALLNCFNRKAGVGIANAQAMGELWAVTPYDCLHWCMAALQQGMTERCMSVVYHQQYSSCQMYSENCEESAVSASGHDLYVRRHTQGDCLGPGESSYSPSPAPPRSVPATYTVSAYSAPGDSPSYRPPSRPTVARPTGPYNAFMLEEDLHANSPAYYTMGHTEHTFCAIMCSDNLTPAGSVGGCGAYTYHTETQQCNLYTDIAQPDGFYALQPAPDCLYAEKFTIDRPPTDCAKDEVFLRKRGYEGQGSVLTTESCRTIKDCVNACLNLTPDCTAATYRSDTGSCIQHFGSPVLVAGSPTSYYVENGCLENSRLPSKTYESQKLFKQNQSGFPWRDIGQQTPNQVAWSSWSSCGLSLRFRARGCKLKNCTKGNFEVQACSLPVQAT